MPQGTVTIDTERCKGCELCTLVCPQNVLVMDQTQINAKGYHPALLDESAANCTGCAICAVMCPDVCINVYREPRKARQRKSTQLNTEVAPRTIMEKKS